MKAASTIQDRAQSAGEELANSFIHGAALLGSIIALPVLVVTASRGGDALRITGAAIFGAALILMYSASTLYHALRAPRVKHILRTIDHSAIYLLIAGTYTPFLFGALRGPFGWTLFGIVWGLALVGIIAKTTKIGFRYPHLSTAFYLAMGWLIVIALKPMAEHMSRAGIVWISAGGLAYTGGVVFYVLDRRLRFGHAVWHGFVAAGSTCHFFAVLWHSA